MSADNYYLIRKHPKGGFALVNCFASDESPPPEATEKQESFPTIDAAMTAFALGQEFEGGHYPRYYCEYGLQMHLECIENVVQ